MTYRAGVNAAVTVLVLAAGSASAQDVASPGGPCRDTTCRITFDWGSSVTPGSDRRYGDPSSLEPLLKREMAALGLRLKESPEGDLRLTVRPRMMNAMCDVMPGTGTDMSCKTVEEMMVDFASDDPAVKPPNSLRIRNRCGDGTTKMDIAQMARFAAGTLSYALATNKKGVSKPAARC